MQAAPCPSSVGPRRRGVRREKPGGVASRDERCLLSTPPRRGGAVEAASADTGAGGVRGSDGRREPRQRRQVFVLYCWNPGTAPVCNQRQSGCVLMAPASRETGAGLLGFSVFVPAHVGKNNQLRTYRASDTLL
jgi:hypothetical protein